MPVFRRGDGAAALDGVVQRVAEDRAQVERGDEAEHAPVHIRHAADVLLLALRQLLGQDDVHRLVAGGDERLEGSHLLQERAQFRRVALPLFEVEQQILHVVVFAVDRFDALQLEVELLLLGGKHTPELPLALR